MVREESSSPQMTACGHLTSRGQRGNGKPDRLAERADPELGNRVRACWASKAGRTADSEVFPRDIQLSHHGVQCGALQAKPGGGLRHNAITFPEYAQDVFSLDMLERGIRISGHVIAAYLGDGGTKSRSPRKNDGPFDEILEFPHVSRPAPFH